MRTAAVVFAAATVAWSGVAVGTSQTPGKSEADFVASTPCDPQIRALVSVPLAITCDFVRWRLTFPRAEPRGFALTVTFGEAQPNTLGFVGGGRSVSFRGSVDTIQQDRSGRPVVIYRLVPRPGGLPITLLRVNDNLLHLLRDDGNLMVGNAGWSYTLNRAQPTDPAQDPRFWLTLPSPNAPATTVFEGRTPCREVADRVGMADQTGCFKIKWKLTLNRDPRSGQPTTYALERTGHREAAIKGEWSIANRPGSGEPAIYRLDPDSPATSLSFLALDDAVLFFLDARGHMLVGNADFSYTLNRRLN